MGLKLYLDSGCTQEVKSPQKFERSEGGAGYDTFVLTALTGAEVGQIYKRNGSTYTRLVNVTDYTIAGNTITLVVALGSGEQLMVLPTNRTDINFGGTIGVNKTTEKSLWIKRTAGYIYDTLQLTSENMELTTQASLTQASVTFVDGVGSGFSGLTPDALIGRALNHNGVFVGMVTDNDATTVTIDDAAYDGASAEAVVFTIGRLLFALDNAGSPGTYKRVIELPDINSDTAVRVWTKDTITIPAAAVNYPNLDFKITGIEYLE